MILLEIVIRVRSLFELAYRVLYLRGHRHIRRQLLLSRYILHHLDWAENNYLGTFENPTVKKNKTIWFLWTQGLDNAPLLVKKCYQSLVEYKEDYDVIVLTRENLDNYVRLPQHVEQLYQDKKMSEAMHSDMIRLYLMIHYGGIWRDATCYQTTAYPTYVKNASFFMYSADLLSYTQPVVCSSWFIKSENRNPLLIKTFNFLCEYHKHFSKPHDYYIFHLTLSVFVRNNEVCKRIWDEMPYVCNMNPHALYFSWGKPYSEELYQHLISSCFIHKLSNKYMPKTIEEQELIYHHLLNR